MIHLPLFRLVCRPRRLLHVLPRPRRIFTRGAGVSAVTKAAVMGGLVCAALPFAALVAPDAMGLPWRQQEAPLHLVEATSSPLDAVRAEILSNPPPMFGTEASSSPLGSGSSPTNPVPPPSVSFLTSNPHQSVSLAGREPVTVPEPAALGVFVAGVVGIILVRRVGA